MNDWPFPVQNMFLPQSCNARQIESVTKSRIIQTNIYIGDPSPYLYVSPYEHIQALDETQMNKPSGKWLPLPKKYNIPCFIDEDIKNFSHILIPSAQGLLYWRCKTADFIDNTLENGALWQIKNHVG